MGTTSVVVITGASRGLGRAAANHFAAGGRHHVVATARQPADLETLRSKLALEGYPIDCRRLDVTAPDSVAELAAWLGERFGRVDVLVNNAGIQLDRFSMSVLDLPIETLRHTLETNLFGALRVTQALMPLLRNSEHGRVVNLSSGMGQLSEMGTGSPAYRISKTALNAVTTILAAELKDTPIKVNSVCPGWCRTDLGGPEAPRSPEQGIDCVAWLATLPADGPSGGFFRDRQPIPW